MTMLLDTILRHAHNHPDKPAVVCDGRSASYGHFARLLLSARAWIERSIPPGDGIVVVVRGDMLLADWVVIIALRSLGRATVAVPDPAMAESLGLAPVNALIFAGGGQAAAPSSPALMLSLPRDALREARNHPLPLSIAEPAFGDYIEYTSGTTGNYKAVRRTGAAFSDLCERVVREYDIDADTVFHLGDLVPWCAVGSKCPVTVWRAGGTCIFDTRPDWARHLLDWPVDRLFVPPPVIEKLAGIAFGRRREALRIYSGGGFVSFPAARALRDRLGCDVFVNYGGTEFGLRMQQLIEREEDVVWLTPFGNDGLEIVDDDGNVCAIGQEGQLRARLEASDAWGYIGNDEATRQFFRAGYFHTGDFAVRREDGRIRVLGRAADVLNIGGTKQPVGPLESRARELLAVEALCLFAQQSDHGKEFLLVVIEQEQECDDRKLESFLAVFGKHFPGVVVKYMPEFPRKGPMRKIDRKAILDSFAT